MNNQQLQIFENPEFGEITAMEIDGNPWFIGKRVAEILEHKNPERAIRKFVEEEDRSVTELVTQSKNNNRGGVRRNTILINEFGLYALILNSQTEKAKSFKHWITHEVLPAIRKTGSYQLQNVQTPDAVPQSIGKNRDIKLFHTPEFGEIIGMEVEGTIYFQATHAAEILGYQDPEDAVSKHCKHARKFKFPSDVWIDILSQENTSESKACKSRNMNFIPEGDLYRLIVNSQLPAVERFESWIFDAVIPAIRMTGYYSISDSYSKTIASPELRENFNTKSNAGKLASVKSRFGDRLNRANWALLDSLRRIEECKKGLTETFECYHQACIELDAMQHFLKLSNVARLICDTDENRKCI